MTGRGKGGGCRVDSFFWGRGEREIKLGGDGEGEGRENSNLIAWKKGWREDEAGGREEDKPCDFKPSICSSGGFIPLFSSPLSAHEKFKRKPVCCELPRGGVCRIGTWGSEMLTQGVVGWGVLRGG